MPQPSLEPHTPSGRSSRFRSSALLLPVLAVGAGLASGAAPPPAEQAHATFHGEIRPLLQKYCTGCHGEKNAIGGINLARFTTVPSVQRDQATWRKVITQLRERTMPPRGAPQPNAQERQRMVEVLTETVNNVDSSLLPKTPGRVLIHRLSRLEYNNTVRDLLGVHSRPADRFPADGGGGGGFDNNAATLFIPPILMERYLEAAAEVLAQAKPARIFIVRPGKSLAPHGIEEIKGSQMRRVALKDGRRGGVLTMAGVLTLTSYPRRTSPVLRGKGVLEEILGSPPPRRPRTPAVCPPTTGCARASPSASGWRSTARSRSAPPATLAWTSSGSGSRTSMPSAAGARRSATPPSTPPARSSPVPPS